jgi:SAM-dependent methyltransferase
LNPELYNTNYFQDVRGGSKGDRLYSGFMSLLESPALDLKVLDLGCGRGEMVERLLKVGIREVHGLDFSTAAVQMTRSRIETRQASLIRQGSATDSSIYEADSFDVIFMLDVVEHLSPPALDDTLRNVNRWLRPQGRVIIHTFPTLAPHRLYQAWLSLTGRHQELDHLNEIHCNVQTRQSLRSAVLSAGFAEPRIWLRNDFTLTSSTFQRLPEGFIKNTLALVLESGLGHPVVGKLFALVGLAELACPSIYCVARPGDAGASCPEASSTLSEG